MVICIATESKSCHCVLQKNPIKNDTSSVSQSGKINSCIWVHDERNWVHDRVSECEEEDVCRTVKAFAIFRFPWFQLHWSAKPGNLHTPFHFRRRATGAPDFIIIVVVNGLREGESSG